MTGRNATAKINEHNNWIPRDFWLTEWEKQAIMNYFLDHPGQGYRRLTYMMLVRRFSRVNPTSAAAATPRHERL